MGSFAASLKDYARKTGESLDDITREVVLEIGTRLVMRSPVGDGNLWVDPPPAGYVGGRFRANWQYGFNAIPSGALPDIDPSGQASIARMRPTVTAGVHYIANNLPYAQRLEDGWSRQAPAGMVGLTVIEFKGIVTDASAGK